MLRLFRAVFLAALFLTLAACARPAPDPSSAPHGPAAFRLTVLHVNDTHSALEPSDAALTLSGRKVAAKLGGFARLKTALDEARGRTSNTLTLHAGDAVQGTLYFNVFQGSVDFEFLNLLGIDAMTLGNHEFDKGPALTGRLMGMARFPVVSANIDASREPGLAGALRKGQLKPWVIREVAGQRIGIIGATTPGTPNLVATVGQVRFHKAAPAVAAAQRELAALGVDKIIVLSHLGYDQDLALARAVPGLDVIVGGHSHTLLGDAARLAPLGLKPVGPYPTVQNGPDGGTTLVVQAWRWGTVLGELAVDFDAQGRVAGWQARPMLLAGSTFRADGADITPGEPDHARMLAALTASGAARVVEEDRGLLARLAPYAAQLDAFRNEPIGATAVANLIRGTATDPGPIIADAYRAAVPGADLALIMPGNVRNDLFQGPITVGQVMGVLPFANTLVALDLTGAELKNALEDAAEFKLKVRPSSEAGGNPDLRRATVLYASGFVCVLKADAPRGQRVREVRLLRPDGSSLPIVPTAIYRLVTNSFLAAGGDGAATLKAATRREDTGLLETDALTDHLRSLKTVSAPRERRVVIEVEGGAGGKVSRLGPPRTGALARAA